jgi:RimJ/RimL family protein N-acetyltransferase
MEIRRITVDDAVAYREVRLQALRDHPEAFGSAYEEALGQPLSVTIERLQEHANSETMFMLGAFTEEGNLVGTIFFNRDTPVKLSHKAHIGAMYTSPTVRGQGVGKALISRVIELTRQMPGLEQIELSVTGGNEIAYRLYSSVGFETYGIEPRGLKVGEKYYDLELMILRLT